jgi:hypothetical protein
MHVLHIINEYDCKKLCIIVLLMLFYIIMALNCVVSTIKCNIVFMLQLGLLWKIESHDKPPTINVETSPSSLQTELDPSKDKPQAMNRSKVWLHFTKVTPIDKEKPKAACNYCNRVLGCHWRHDTSALKNHLTYNCPTSPPYIYDKLIYVYDSMNFWLWTFLICLWTFWFKLF